MIWNARSGSIGGGRMAINRKPIELHGRNLQDVKAEVAWVSETSKHLIRHCWPDKLGG